jgi:hypothetical protein
VGHGELLVNARVRDRRHVIQCCADRSAVHSDAEIETVITSLGREPGGALFVAPDNFMQFIIVVAFGALCALAAVISPRSS